jgi:hypothetical protein
MRLVAPAWLAAALGPLAAFAAELHVPDAFPTVSAALDAAAPGDEIVLAPGVFPLASERSGIDVTIRGAGRGVSILDGGGTSVLVLDESNLVLRSVTVRNGEDGVELLADSTATLEDVRFEGNTRDGFELNRRSSAVATNCEFVNQGDDGIDMQRNASFLCTGCVITDNEDDGIEIRLNPFEGPPVAVEIASSRIERNGGVGIQLIDYTEATLRSFHFHDLVIAGNVDGGVTWQCCGDSGEDLDGWPGDEPVLIEHATIVGNGGPGVEGGAAGLMRVRESILFDNGFDLYQVGGPLGVNLIGVDPLFTTDYRLSFASPAVWAAEDGGDLGAYPMRECSNGVDDDADTRIDVDDTGCAGIDDPAEYLPVHPGCGLGAELAPLLALYGALRLRRRGAAGGASFGAAGGASFGAAGGASFASARSASRTSVRTMRAAGSTSSTSAHDSPA